MREVKPAERVTAFDNFQDQWVWVAASTIFFPTKAVTRYAGSRRTSDSHHGFADSAVARFRHPLRGFALRRLSTTSSLSCWFLVIYHNRV